MPAHLLKVRDQTIGGEMGTRTSTAGHKGFPPKRDIPRKRFCFRGYFPSKAMGDYLKYESKSVEKKMLRFLDILSVTRTQLGSGTFGRN
ncbi:MAG: hypothetical protein A2X80_11095 [Geobacteraceae bacterium GWB2_52_12]|nr:MAG: hypothetical protein A2X80_11095 [Geobacteraceae bacterium GWB2_52_12]